MSKKPVINGIADNGSQILLKALSEINREFVDPQSNKRTLFKKMLESVLVVTGSEYGFIGEVIRRDGAPVLKTFAITDISWNEETALLYKKYEELGMEFTNLNTLFGYTLRTGELVISNDPANDSKRGGLPKGHPALNCYMGIPIRDNSNVMIGMLGIANKQGGYDNADEEFLHPMISLSAAFISAIKANEAKEFFSGTLDYYRKAIDSHAIVSVTDVHGAISYVNEKFCQLAKFTPSELIGKNHVLVNSGYHSKEFFRNLWDTILGGKIWKGEIRNRAKDGSIYWVSATIVPFLNEEKRPFQFVAIRNDITRLKEQERELSNFFRLSMDLLCIADTEGKILKVSESFPVALGMREDEIVNSCLSDLVHPDDRKSMRRQIEKIKAGGSGFAFENRILLKDNTCLELSWKGTINREEGLLYVTATDITEKKRIEEKLIESKIEVEKARAKDTFLANMSHEIRTPLNAIVGFNELLRQTSLTREQRGHVEIIGNALKNLNVIINDILDLSKLESGKLELEHRPFSLENMLKHLVKMHIARAKAKNLKLMLSFDSEIPEYIVGDETRLSQVLINLISNAIKFTSIGGIWIEVSETARVKDEVKIRFSVKDSGIGIEPSKIGLVFERFTQAEDYTTRIYGGTGLGLNIVKSLIDLHGGQLTVDSTPGKGSEFAFEIVFPVAESLEEALAGSHFPDQPAGKRSLKDMKVLVVDDNEHNQILARAHLEREGVKVDVAGNGQEAIDLIRQKTYDAVFMDIQMPQMDGLQTTEMIRNELQLSFPIIGCSAHALESERRRCFLAGMSDYVTKPYTGEDLLNALIRLKPSSQGYAENRKQQTEENFSIVDDFETRFQELEKQFGRKTMEVFLNVLLDRIPSDMRHIESSLESADLKKLESVTHNLFGSFGSLQLKQGMHLAKSLETAARNQDHEKSVSLSGELLEYLRNAQAKLALI